MSEQLRMVGPLFLVIDDSQWADRDSLNVLDRLQSAVGKEGLGIITVSRESDDPQRVPASKRIELGPLPEEDAVGMLARSAARWSVDVVRFDAPRVGRVRRGEVRSDSRSWPMSFAPGRSWPNSAGIMIPR